MREFPTGALEFGASSVFCGAVWLAVLLSALLLRRRLLLFPDLSLGRSGELLYFKLPLLVLQACSFRVSKLTTALFIVRLGVSLASLRSGGA